MDAASEASKHPVMFFSRDGCHYCEKLARELGAQHIPFTVFKVTRDEQGDELKRQLVELTNVKTFPQLFIGGRFIGGYTDFIRLSLNGEIKEALNTIGIDYDQHAYDF